jgi:hypothetical protein
MHGPSWLVIVYQEFTHHAAAIIGADSYADALTACFQTTAVGLGADLFTRSASGSWVLVEHAVGYDC